MNAADTIAELSGVGLTYAGGGGLRDIDLAVRRGENLGITGKSGCGKSTLLRLLTGLLQPQDGIVLRHSRRLAMVFQEPRLLPWLTALSNVRLVLPDAPESEMLARASLYDVGLKHALHLLPAQLSGGMAQRVGIARALATDPDLLVMDEPLANLDSFARAGLLDLLKTRTGDRGLTTVFVSHDVRDLAVFCDRVLVLDGHPGRIAGLIERPRQHGLRRALFDYETAVIDCIDDTTTCDS